MSPESVEFIARLLMKWWKEDYEKKQTTEMKQHIEGSNSL